MRTETHMQTSSRTRVLEIAATISYFTARNIRLDTESSKLLILSPHNDTITDLEDVLGAPDADLPPTLYDFYIVTLFRLHFLASRLDEFPKRNHNNQEVTPHPNSITNLAIFAHIKDNAPLILELETLATLPVIISIAIDFPRYFTSYCTLSNTVKAIGIGGTASLFLSVKMSRFLADSKEAEARNLVALTRSKGLCVVLLPFTDKFPSSALHSLRTLCGYRHGIFTVGSAPLDHVALAQFLSQPDTVLDDVPYTYDASSWQVAHQLTSFGNWILLSMVIGLSYGSTTYFFPLTIRDQIPGSNHWQLAAENFEWHGTLPGHPLVILSFAQNSLTLTAQKVHIARFPYPSPNTRSNVDSLEPPGWTMFPAPGSYFFAAASLSRGHVHPVKPLVIDPTDYPLPPLLIRWPQTSPGKASNLPLATPAEMFPVPGWLSQDAKALFEKGPAFLASSTCLVDENLVVRDWLPAYCAHTIPGFGEDHLLTIVAPEVISAFGSRVASPLLDGEQGVALDYLKSVLESAEEPWQVKTRRHRPPPLPVGAPDDQQILLFSSTQTSRLEKKVDELFPKLAELCSLLASGELAHSPAGWVTLNTLKAYTGPAVPGNFNPRTQTVVASKPYTLTHQSVPLRLDEQLLQNIIAIDDKTGRRRFQVGVHAVGGRKELALRLRPVPARTSTGSVPSPPAATYVPTPSLRPTAPFAVYFCSPTMIKLLTSAGINPRRRGTPLGPYILKLHPLSDLKDSSLSHTFGSSRLRGKSGAMLIVNISTSLAAGVRWDVADNGMYCTNDVPLQPSYLHSAYCFNHNQLVRTWGGDITEGPPRPPPPARPQWAQQQQHSPTDDVLDSQADYRLQAHTQAPIPPPVPPDEEMPTEDVGQGDPLQYSAATMGALTHLLTQIDGPTSTLSSTLTPGLTPPLPPCLFHIHGPALSLT